MSRLPSYPRNLGYVVNRLIGYHRNQIQIVPASSTSVVAPNGQIIINLPENTILDLSSFRVVIPSLQSSCGLSATANEPGIKAALPFVQALIQRVDISVNGITITNGLSEYSSAFRLVRNM